MADRIMDDTQRVMNHPHAAQQALPPPPLQHPRSAGLIQQQQRGPNSPHQQHHPLTSQGPYASPHSSTHSLPPQHQSPYVGPVQAIPHQHPGETTFFGTHPSPYSTNSAPGSYPSSVHGLGITSAPEPGENMAAQASIRPQPYPPISSYQTPQSNSPASIHSPQTDGHGRPMYGIPPMPQQMYYQPQYQMQQPPYGQPPSASHHPSMASAPPTLMSYQQQMPQAQQPQHHQSQPQPNMVDSKPSQGSLQRPPPVIAPPHGTPQTPSGQAVPGLPPSSAGSNPSAAPGPIPATTPLVVRQDNNGVQWIAFEYSRDRVKMEYTIRCDVESVNVEELSPEFKSANCVYPRACCGKEQYKGNRLHYESECNAVGWALAQLNPPLREKRGLIQRAVDSWRNSNQDVRLRSRRVRRMAKIHNRKTPGGMGSSTAGQLPGTQGPTSAGLQTQQAAPEYNSAPAHHHQPPPNSQAEIGSPSSSTARYVAQNFYPAYPQNPSVGPSTMPSVHGAMEPMHPHASTLAAPVVKKEDESRKRKLFGDVPEAKRRKFILVEDGQRGTRVRVRVMLDQVRMDDMPDAHLKINAVYPRSYYPRQTGSPSGSPRALATWDDEEDEVVGAAGTMPTRGKTMAPISLMDGTDSKMAVPRMTKSKRSKEVALNELGYRMSWGQARTFNGRTLFLQRSLDAYRNKMRSTMVAAGQDVTTIEPHFETRPGKRKWLDRVKRPRRAESP